MLRLTHPAIARSFMRKDISPRGQVNQTLVIETSLKVPKMRTYADADKDFENLIDYLANLTDMPGYDFNKLEIRTRTEEKKEETDVA